MLKFFFFTGIVIFTLLASCTKMTSECEARQKDQCVCTMQYDPVCGCNGVTYGNPCIAGCHSIYVYTRGVCPGDCEESPACSLIPDAGPCDAAFPKYYYDRESVSCKEFIWGGCEGVVPFDTLEECEAACICK